MFRKAKKKTPMRQTHSTKYKIIIIITSTYTYTERTRNVMCVGTYYVIMLYYYFRDNNAAPTKTRLNQLASQPFSFFFSVFFFFVVKLGRTCCRHTKDDYKHLTAFTCTSCTYQCTDVRTFIRSVTETRLLYYWYSWYSDK